MNSVLEAANFEVASTVAAGFGALVLGTTIDTALPLKDDDTVMDDVYRFAGHLALTGISVLIYDELFRSRTGRFEGLASGGIFFTVLMTSQPTMRSRIATISKDFAECGLEPAWANLTGGLQKFTSMFLCVPNANTASTTSQANYNTAAAT